MQQCRFGTWVLLLLLLHLLLLPLLLTRCHCAPLIAGWRMTALLNTTLSSQRGNVSRPASLPACQPVTAPALPSVACHSWPSAAPPPRS